MRRAKAKKPFPARATVNRIGLVGSGNAMWHFVDFASYRSSLTHSLTGCDSLYNNELRLDL